VATVIYTLAQNRGDKRYWETITSPDDATALVAKYNDAKLAGGWVDFNAVGSGGSYSTLVHVSQLITIEA